MEKEINIGAPVGLNNRKPLARMDASTDAGAGAWLRSAINIDLSSDGYLRRRQGFQLVQAGDFHSLWSDGKDAYAVVNGSLSHLSPEPTPIEPNVRNPVTYARFPDGAVYWSDGNKAGRMNGQDNKPITPPMPNPVPAAQVVDAGLPAGRYQVCFTRITDGLESAPTEAVMFDLPENKGLVFSGVDNDTLIYVTGANGEIFNEISGNYLSPIAEGAECPTFGLAPIPAGQALAHYRGSLLMAAGNYLYVSEPYLYGLHNPVRGFIPFPEPISVVAPCEDGFYVCADKTYWLPADPLNTTPIVVLPYGALAKSLVIDDESMTVYWQSKHGIVLAKPSGSVTLPQNQALQFDPADTGVSWLREQNGERHLITTRERGE